MLIGFRNSICAVFLICLMPGSICSKELSYESCEIIANCIFSNRNYSLSERMEVWKELKSDCSTNGSYQEELLDYYLKNERFDEARSLIEKESLSNKKKNPEFLNILQKVSIFLNIQQGLYDKARSELSEYLKEERNLFEGYSLLGHLYFCESGDLGFSKKYLEESKRWYKKALRETENFSDIAKVYSELLIVSYFLKESHEEVLKNFEMAWKYNPNKVLLNASSCYFSVLSLLSKGDVDMAKHILDSQEKLGLGLEHKKLSIDARKAILKYEGK